MSRIFLSHSSKNNADAIALRDWLKAEGWDDVFLDLDPVRGIAAGERWERRLNEAADRCEAVLFLVSPDWLASGWCLKEYRLADKLNKRMFALLIAGLGVGDLPREIAGDWQVVDLDSGRDHRMFRAVMPNGASEAHVHFSQDGLARLKTGLTRAGLDPKFFAWPPEREPNRAPYRGLKALDADDAGIFFGREGPTVLALDKLRGLRDRPGPRILAILGASGAGKSSFLRAGLTPRLERDDRHFLPLPIIRPERAALTGATGLAASLTSACARAGLAVTRAQAQAAIHGGADEVGKLLERLAASRRLPSPIDGQPAQAPTLVVSIDQGEELFLAEGAAEADALLKILADLMKQKSPSVIVLVAIRSDAYERLQSAPALEGVAQDTFSLPPMPRGAYENLIEGPARRMTEARRPLIVEPQLTQALLAEIETGGAKDALPLLAFTLERLFLDHGGDGDMTLAEYCLTGGVKGSIEAAVEQAMRSADADPRIPRDRDQRLALLRRALIPRLADIDPETGAPRRRIARLAEIPEEAQPLVEQLVSVRLLATDRDVASGAATVEPAHEALLRQWGILQGWLEEDFAALSTLDGVKRAAREWEANARNADWLAHAAGRLEDAIRFGARDGLYGYLDASDQAYLSACRAHETAKHASDLENARRLIDANAAILRGTRLLFAGALILILILAGALLIIFEYAKDADDQKKKAIEQRDHAETERHKSAEHGRITDLLTEHLSTVKRKTLSQEERQRNLLKNIKNEAEHGNKIAMRVGAALLFYGSGAERDLSMTIGWLEKLAADGDSNSFANLGFLYSTGYGVATDYAKAREFYVRGARAGHAGAMLGLGGLYAEGLGVERDYAKARHWYEKAAAAGNADAMYNLGFIYAEGQGVPPDDGDARKWFEKAADAGSTEAIIKLGAIYDTGQGVAQDQARARALYEKAAEAGDTRAMYILGLTYQDSSGVTQDQIKARAWYEKAAAAGNADAMFSLGVIFDAGRDVAQDHGKAREWYEKAAAAGNATAMFNLGSHFHTGRGILRDYDKAREWYEKAAAAGNASAMHNLGVIYDQGQGAPQDYGKAREWYEKAAAAGNDKAMFRLGLIYDDGKGIAQDYAKARMWHEKAAAAGNTEAMFELGLIYDDGKGVVQDHSIARAWYEKAAAAGSAGAMRNLGDIYAEGQGVPQDHGKARAWYEKAADAGDAGAMVKLGLIYEKGKGVAQDQGQARAWYEKAADAGDAVAMYNLGVFFGNGYGVAKDYVKAREWYEKAAAAGEAGAMYALGTIYDYGHGVPENHGEARAWYEKAAAAGNDNAMFNLGGHFHTGRGMPLDYAKARAWYEKAANVGNDRAMFNLGLIYSNGHGIARDYAKARAWYEKAADVGNSSAMFNLAKLNLSGLGGEKNYKRALQLLEKAYEAGRADAILEVSWVALLAREPARALAAADTAIAAAKQSDEALLPKSTRAHALMFLDRRDEAMAVYRAEHGRIVPGENMGRWEYVIRADFFELRKVGLGHPLMTEIEFLFDQIEKPRQGAPRR